VKIEGEHISCVSETECGGNSMREGTRLGGGVEKG
jgi:hypothetical protein